MTQIANIYGEQPKKENAMTQTASAREVAEIQGAMVIAKKFPRDQRDSFDRIMNACQRKSLAEQAVYQYSRGGQDITGPSIRLAEAMAREWGNIHFGVNEVAQENGTSTVEAYAYDLETNVRCTKVFQVKHRRETKKGGYDLTDPRDIYELVANQGSRRVRACILGVIPGDVVDAALEQCETTLRADCEPTPEVQKKLLEAFAKYGVTKEQIEIRIQRKMDAITAAQVLSLRKIYNSLKDGMSKPDEWFEIVTVKTNKNASLVETVEEAKQ